MFRVLTRIKNAFLYKQGVHFFLAEITIARNFVYNRNPLAIGDMVSISPNVTKDVPPYTIVAGNLTRKIKDIKKE